MAAPQPLALRPIRGASFDPPRPDAAASLFPQIPNLKKRRYLEALATTPRIAEACRLAAVDRKSAYNWAKDESDAEFQAALKIAAQLGLQRAIDEGWKRGVDGWEEPVYQGGRLVGTKLVKSDLMLIFMLKGELPGKYRDVQEQRHTGPGGGPIQVQSMTFDVTKLSLEQLKALEAAQQILEPARVLPE